MRTGALVEVVDILRHDQQLARPMLIKPGQRPMGGVGFDRGKRATPLVVEVEHQLAVSEQRLGRANLLDAAPFPQPFGSAKGREAALGRNARTGQHDDRLDVRHQPSIA